MKIRTTITLFLSVIGISYLSAQSLSLEIQVTHKGAPVPFAQLELNPSGLTGLSNSQGRYVFNGLVDQSYRLTISAYGLKLQQMDVDLSQIKAPLLVQLELDNSSLQEVVVSAGRNPILRHQSPIIVSRLNTRIFEATQALSMAEGLNFSPGLRLEVNCQNCGFTQVRMNGLDGAYTQVLLNNRPIFSSLAAVYGLELIPTAMIDRVEVIRGAGSVLYGGSAIAGTLNVITKEPKNEHFEASINQSFTNLEASDRSFNVYSTTSGREQKSGFGVYAFRRDRESWDANNDKLTEITELANTTLGLDAFFDLGKYKKIKSGVHFINEYRRGGARLDLPPHQSPLAEQLVHEIFGGHLSFEQVSVDLRNKFSGYLAFQSVNRNSYYGAGGRVLELGDTLESLDFIAQNAYGYTNDLSFTAGMQFSREITSRTILLLGSEFQHGKLSDQMLAYSRNSHQSMQTLGNFCQVDFKSSEKWQFLGGVRWDFNHLNSQNNVLRNDFFKPRVIHAVMPRFSIMYTQSKNWRYRAGYAQGYRTPQIFNEDLHIETVGGAARIIQLDVNLQVEQSNSYTASVQYDKATEIGQLTANMEFFFTELRNPFILSEPIELENGVAIIQKRNGKGAFVAGFNVESQMAFKKLYAQIGFTLQNANYRTFERLWTNPDQSSLEHVETNRILRTPIAYGSSVLSYKLKHGFSVDYSTVFTGSMLLAHTVNPETEFVELKNSSVFWEHNFKASKLWILKAGQEIDVSISLQNIFDAFQNDFDFGLERDASYVYGPFRPRTVGVKVNYCFSK